MDTKITGYVLLIIGILAIVFALTNVYLVFTKNSTPVDLFTFDAISLDFSEFADETPQDTNLVKELIKPEVINEPLNYAAYLLFMGFVASIGYKLASVGVMLLRPIKVKVKKE